MAFYGGEVNQTVGEEKPGMIKSGWWRETLKTRILH